MADLRVRLDEIVPVKTAVRELPAQIARLTAGEVEHLVITRRNEPQVVLITVQRYEELLSR
jgi:PHD/YefM family antitoxin component YafN of YafNO toxin-antitoxin module